MVDLDQSGKLSIGGWHRFRQFTETIPDVVSADADEPHSDITLQGSEVIAWEPEVNNNRRMLTGWPSHLLRDERTQYEHDGDEWHLAAPPGRAAQRLSACRPGVQGRASEGIVVQSPMPQQSPFVISRALKCTLVLRVEEMSTAPSSGFKTVHTIQEMTTRCCVVAPQLESWRPRTCLYHQYNVPSPRICTPPQTHASDLPRNATDRSRPGAVPQITEPPERQPSRPSQAGPHRGT